MAPVRPHRNRRPQRHRGPKGLGQTENASGKPPAGCQSTAPRQPLLPTDPLRTVVRCGRGVLPGRRRTATAAPPRLAPSDRGRGRPPDSLGSRPPMSRCCANSASQSGYGQTSRDGGQRPQRRGGCRCSRSTVRCGAPPLHFCCRALEPRAPPGPADPPTGRGTPGSPDWLGSARGSARRHRQQRGCR